MYMKKRLTGRAARIYNMLYYLLWPLILDDLHDECRKKNKAEYKG